MRGTPIPAGRDQLGLYGGPISVGSGAMSVTDSEVVIGLNDFMIEFWAIRSHEKQCYILYFSGGVQCSLVGVPGTDQLRLNLPVSTYILSNNFVGDRLIHGLVFAHRSGYAYAYMDNVDGYAETGKDISGDAASNLNANNVYWGGRLGGGESILRTLAMARLFIIDPSDFPDEDERMAIAAQRFDAPTVESPALARRTNYATERRIDVDFVDVDQIATTVPNHGTAPDLTIGSTKAWRHVRTRVASTAMERPPVDWFHLDGTHTTSASTVALGCSSGSFISEAVALDLHVGPTLSAWYLWRVANAAATEAIGLYYYNNEWRQELRTNSVNYINTMWEPGQSDFGRYQRSVFHTVYDADAGKVYHLINNQILRTLTVAQALNLSGNVDISFAARGTRILAGRLWNGSLPSDWRDVTAARVSYPWTVDRTFTGMDLKANHELSATAQEADSTVIKNRAQASIGDLKISGSDDYGTARLMAMRGTA